MIILRINTIFQGGLNWLGIILMSRQNDIFDFFFCTYILKIVTVWNGINLLSVLIIRIHSGRLLVELFERL